MSKEVKRVLVKETFEDALSKMFSEEQIKNMPKQERIERERMYMAGMASTIVIFTADMQGMSEQEHGEMIYSFMDSVEEYWQQEAGL